MVHVSLRGKQCCDVRQLGTAPTAGQEEATMVCAGSNLGPNGPGRASSCMRPLALDLQPGSPEQDLQHEVVWGGSPSLVGCGLLLR
jgi:hypothetical protein